MVSYGSYDEQVRRIVNCPFPHQFTHARCTHGTVPKCCADNAGLTWLHGVLAQLTVESYFKGELVYCQLANLSWQYHICG